MLRFCYRNTTNETGKTKKLYGAPFCNKIRADVICAKKIQAQPKLELFWEGIRFFISIHWIFTKM